MNTIATPDGTQIYFKDWGEGQPIVFSHGWPLSSDAFEDQMFFLASRGYRCIAHDRRGHGRSSQPWNGQRHGYLRRRPGRAGRGSRPDGRDPCRTLDGRRRGRPLYRSAWHRTVAKAVLISADPAPDAEDGGQSCRHPDRGFDQLRAAVQADRSQFWKDLSLPFYGYNRPGATVSEGVRESFWLQGMMAGFPASYFCIKAFSETDLTEDLKKFDVPTLILHGDDDQIVPIAASAMLSSKLIKNATLKVYEGAPHGMCTTLKDRVNADLLAVPVRYMRFKQPRSITRSCDGRRRGWHHESHTIVPARLLSVLHDGIGRSQRVAHAKPSLRGSAWDR